MTQTQYITCPLLLANSVGEMLSASDIDDKVEEVHEYPIFR